MQFTAKLLKRALSQPDLEYIRRFRSKIRLQETGVDEPTSGQCGWVAEMIYHKFRFKVEGGFYLKDGPTTPHNHSDHTWNVMPDGSVFDATHDQFGPPDILIAAPGSPDFKKYHPFCGNPKCPHCACPECNPDGANEDEDEDETDK